MRISISMKDPSKDLPQGFLYVSQDNYFIANLNDDSSEIGYLYSDSATSCVIIVLEGKDFDGNPIVALTHLSRPEKFEGFFNIVDKNFCGGVTVFAQGANPPDKAFRKYPFGINREGENPSLINSDTVIKWISSNTHLNEDNGSAGWYIEQSTISLGMGDPRLNNRGCFGIDLKTMVVSNQKFLLKPEDRDPQRGVQTLFAVFGSEVFPDEPLHDAGKAFSAFQIDSLVEEADKNGWTDILKMSSAEVLSRYSSTPDFEVPWFFEVFRDSAEFVRKIRMTQYR